MKKTIGIITLHSAHNYGSVFQAYAMSRVMQKMGLEPKIIDFRHPKTTAMYEFVWWSKTRSLKANISNIFFRGLLGIGKEREKRFNDFIEKNMPLTDRYAHRSEIAEHFDYLVCGSDQIWNPKASSKNDPAYFLDFGDPDTIRFSYAASCGGAKFAEGCEDRIRCYLNRFSKIGVREASMKEYVNQKLGFECSVNPDPTALLDMDDWTALEQPVENIPDKYILVYSIRDMPKVVAFAASVGRKMQLPVIQINQARGRNACIKVDGVVSLENPAPGQFLWLYHRASFVISNTFHGNMFAIIYRKNFVWCKTNPNDARLITLHNTLGFGNKYQIAPNESVDELNFVVSYDDEKMKLFKKSGYDYIESVVY